MDPSMLNDIDTTNYRLRAKKKKIKKNERRNCGPDAALGELALDGERIAEGAVLLVDALHLHEAVARRRLLQDARVDLVEPLLQLLAPLVRRQVAVVLLGFRVRLRVPRTDQFLHSFVSSAANNGKSVAGSAAG